MRLPRTIRPYGDRALLIEWEQLIDTAINRSVQAYAAAVAEHPAVSECVPAYSSLLVIYAQPAISYYELTEYIYEIVVQDTEHSLGILHRIPVCYGGEYGPDLATVATTAGLSTGEVVKQHTERQYFVYFLGYRPGFAFLGETAANLEVPRRDSPRPRVPAGTVGLAGRQTGIYPTVTPGGWQLIGRCPWPVLGTGGDLCRFRAGDRVEFYAVSPGAYAELQQNPEPWPRR